MRLITADWIFPGDGIPVKNGAVLLHGETVLDVGPRDRVEARVEGVEEIHCNRSALIPGLINCHTHLDLGGLSRLPVRDGFVGWLRDLLKQKEALSEEEILDGAERAALVMYTLGTAYVADVSSSPVTILALINVGLPGTLFREFLGLDLEAKAAFDESLDLFDPHGMEEITVLPACHAPFSTSPELFEAVGQWSRLHGCPTMVHLAESEAETELLQTGESELKDFLIDRGIPSAQIPFPKTGPVEYLDSFGFLNEHTIAVHLVQADESQLQLLKERGVSPCLCPSSNLHLAGNLPQVEKMLSIGMKPCLGTDSPASGESLSLFKEMGILLDAGIKAEDVLRMGTVNGALALRLPDDYGRLMPGCRTTILSLPCDTRGGTDPLVSALRGGADGWGKWVISPQNVGPVRVQDTDPAEGNP